MVKVKWQGKKYEVDVDTTAPGEVFKMQLFSLTGVAPDRQKVLVKGGQLKDDTDMSTLGLKENQILMMMGTVGELPKAPAQQVKFVEDMSEAEMAQALSIPAGLVNMGNTCYMNATLQCLKAVPALKEALDVYKGTLAQSDARGNLVASLKKLFQHLSESGEGVPPLVFLQFLRQVFPKFAEQDPQFGGYRQQDAEECWTDLVTTLDHVLKTEDASFVSKYMTGEMETPLKTDEAPDEPSTVNHERFRKLSCPIDKSVNYLAHGIRKGLEQTIEKNSDTLGRNAEYTGTSRITRLPEYLSVTFNRFSWKATESVGAKIVKSVKFPLDFDASEFCTAELQDKMRPAKQFLREKEDKEALERKMAKKAQLAVTDESQGGSKEAPKEDAEVKPEDGAAGSEAKPFELDAALKADVGCNPSGIYELVGVVTHIGRSVNSGHYMGWVRKEKGVGGPDPSPSSGKNVADSQHWWYKFDDDDVSLVTDEEILKLCGGGDWHTAYILLYRAKKLD
ncbi:deubiquitinating enzyme [Coemansia sp. RSA 1813]|nr:deubiquitinating enzyme [Coemansia sp. RSA 1843]KAJ2092883.1 deubiquitinating enzyme [Coemansia sp. RSA 986]KAJ2216204.1 deubiquitinating enzyme [Coemansia sp. RSA 487]KAJ2570623.1 deubiquitinating enzyme [Coemansia sp. RSA 1813]